MIRFLVLALILLCAALLVGCGGTPAECRETVKFWGAASLGAAVVEGGHASKCWNDSRACYGESAVPDTVTALLFAGVFVATVNPGNFCPADGAADVSTRAASTSPPAY